MPRPVSCLLSVLFSLLVLLVHCASVPAHAQKSERIGEPPKLQSKNVWPYLTAEPSPEKVAENLLARNFVLVFDGSGSMNETECAEGKTKVLAAKLAVREWCKSVPPEANVGVVAPMEVRPSQPHGSGLPVEALEEVARRLLMRATEAAAERELGLELLAPPGREERAVAVPRSRPSRSPRRGSRQN